MKVNLTSLIVDLDKKPIKLNDKDLEIGRAVALSLIGGAKSSDPMRAYLLSQDLLGKTEIELNQSDVEFIRVAVKDSEMFTDIVKGQLLVILK